ncbi:MAG: response regulator [Spirochaetia bacterium]
MKKPSLLYVDDEFINLLAFKSQFRRDYSVFCAGDATKAFEQLEENRIDVVFSDQRMPDMPGTEFLKKVKKQYPNTCRIIISGFTEDKAIQHGLESGIIHKAFEKPYQKHQILDFIENKEDEKDET